MVRTNHGNLLAHCLSDEMAIEWISMVEWQVEEQKRMISRKREHSDVQIHDRLSNVVRRERQLTTSVFNCNLGKRD